MTRAQIADAELVAKVRAGNEARVRPCVLCNQMCAVRDNRNPIVSCVVDPFSGHESTEVLPEDPVAISRSVLVVGGGPAGLEAARVAAMLGHSVMVAERGGQLGGNLRLVAAQPGRHRFADFADWLVGECIESGVDLRTGTEVDADSIERPPHVIVATGGRRGEPGWPITSAATVWSATDVLGQVAGGSTELDLPEGDVMVWDPIGGPTGVAVAELLAANASGRVDVPARRVHLVTPDYIVGNELARSGDLGPANSRLANAGVELHRRRILQKVRKSSAALADRFSDEIEEVDVSWVVDCGHRLPDNALEQAIRESTGHTVATAGDCVAPRTVGEAVLEGRRRALEVT